jgi:hypothetical protein
MADAIDDKDTRAEAVRRLQENLKNRRSVLPTLELAARLNREIGLGSEDRPPRITITFVSNLRPGALRRGHEAALRLPARPDGTRQTAHERMVHGEREGCSAEEASANSTRT